MAELSQRCCREPGRSSSVLPSLIYPAARESGPVLPPAPAGSQNQPQQAAQVNKTLCNSILSSTREDWRKETPPGHRAPLGEHFPATELTDLLMGTALESFAWRKGNSSQGVSASPSTGQEDQCLCHSKRTSKNSTSAGKLEFIYLWLQLLFKTENLKRSGLLNQKGCLSFAFKHTQVSEHWIN